VHPALAQIQRPNLALALKGIDKIVAFVRTHPTEPILIIHNISGRMKRVTLGEEEAAFARILFRTHNQEKINLKKLMLPAYGSIILGK